MADAAGRSDDYCYRHPDRQSFVLCQRCGRTICPQCQIQAPVGVQCPECVRDARKAQVKRPPAVLRAFRPGSEKPVVTYTLIALCVLVYLGQWLTNGALTSALFYHPLLTVAEPWRMLTSAFAHSQGWILHILFNMYALLILGPGLEKMLGRMRFLALYLLSAFGGSVAVLWLSPYTGVLGASGAIFGLFGAFFIIIRGLGGNAVHLLVIIGLNLVIGFVVPNVSWEGHLGGLVVGVAAGLIFMRTRRADQQRAQVAMLVGLAAALIAITVAGVLIRL